MTTTIISHPSPLWNSYLSSEEEERHRKNTVFWKTAQSVTVAVLCIFGAGILISPYILPITYTNILMNAFTFIPLILPIPGYFYSYCSLQAAKATKIVEKILFFRANHPKIENNKDSLNTAIKETFGEALSRQKISSLKSKQNISPIVLSHINFVTNEIRSLEEKREELYKSLSFYKEKDFNTLLENSLFVEWKDLISEAKKSWMENQNSSDSLKFLDNLIKIINNSSTKNQEALLELRNLHWQWRNKDSLPLAEKWAPLFALDEQILTAKTNRLFLWTFLLLPEKELENSLNKHGLQIENALYDFKTTKTSLSFQELSIALLYQDPSSEKLLSLFHDTITKEEILDPKKREEVLDKFLLDQLSKNIII